MARIFKSLSLIVGLLFILGVFGLLLLLALTGNPVDFVQKSFLRISLNQRQAELNRPVGTDSRPQRFSIQLGETPNSVAHNLLNQALISDAQLFVDYLRLEDLDTELEAGTYFLNQTQTIPQIARILINSRNSSLSFTLLDGWRLEEIATAIDNNGLFGFSGADFLSLVAQGALIPADFAAQMGIPAGASLEGFLYPDTYVLPPEISATALRDTLLQQFQTQVSPLLASAQAQGFTMYQVVNLASIIEREAIHPEEHAMIASVYRNRLNIGMLLQADPTIQYALNGSRGAWWTPLTLADYQNVISPYNTYLNYGLPPSPIATPSLSAIQAALFPTQSNYYYFRAKCDGSGYHNFAVTYEEHLAYGC